MNGAPGADPDRMIPAASIEPSSWPASTRTPRWTWPTTAGRAPPLVRRRAPGHRRSGQKRHDYYVEVAGQYQQLADDLTEERWTL